MPQTSAAKFSRRPLFIALLAAAQCLAQRPEFEVATLKLSPPPEGDLININLGRTQNGKLTMANVTLGDCIKYAWNLSSNAQFAGPAWLNEKLVRFDIVAQAKPGTPPEQVRLMLQNLLADRLKLTTHVEKREISYLALVPAKNGPKLQPAKPDTPQNTGPQLPGKLSHNAMGMDMLTRLLARFERDTVIDQTGLQGQFEIHLEWEPSNRNNPDGPSGPSVYTALQEQLGLRLIRQKGPVDILVVDHAEQVPADN